MGNDVFDGQILAEKLWKLNNSQQSIESLSRLCVSHRKRAKEIVETWDKLFSSSQKEQRISFLYLANDILQNSRRKGSEFVNEFWKVLPTSLRRVYESDELGKKVVTRLFDVWEERKVFGSRGQVLKDEIMGKNTLPSSTSNGKSSNPIKIVKRDAHSVRLKLAVGCLPEKILTSLHSIHDKHLSEEAALDKCNTVVHQVDKLVEDAENTLAQGNQLGSTFVNDLQEQEEELKQYMVHLETAEADRASLLSQLKDALQEQESRQHLLHNQLLAARGLIEQVASIRKRLGLAPEGTRVLEQNLPSVQQPNSTPLQPSFSQPSISFAPLQTTEEDKKAAAAAVAAKLAASTSSALMLTSVLSSLVAEEAASMNGSLNSTGFPVFNPEKRPKLEKQIPVSEVNSNDTGSSSFFSTLQKSSVANVSLTQSASLQPISQPNQLQAAFASGPPPPPHSPVSPPANQYVQSTGLMVGGIPYAYGSNNLPPPPPLPPHVAMGLSRPSTQPSQSQAQQAQQQQQSSTGGFYRPPGIGFYGQSHSSTSAAPLPRP
ncbi:regulation of nuclear pre-mRNA domain-containing protein 1B-like [Abrus precatorius]|uniref:Regulation of nuclear pre-mRNA domain-containing protein 1B-like n=1 Tax=Abrus precatorius TaxID=3816 RepID=A0A8B8LQ37_ABRPR|nr:regulation of nuclear pre-mRNA domain-containing protein 1B-like [Abrus precatorius]XP_027358486.1 regulation of nuclear pre-mRNA domain-containing protein 1B-like [Abrus precatorius]